MSEELPRIQEKVYYRQIDSHSDILETFLSEQSHLRHNPKIVQEEKDHQSFVSLTAFVLRNDLIFSKLQFLHSPKTEDDVKPLTHLIVVDLTSKEGLKLLLQGVRYLLHGSERSRIGILYNSDIDVPNFEELPTMFLINTIQISLSSKQRHKTLDFLKQLITWYEKEYLSDSNKTEINVESFIEAVSKLAEANDLKHDIMTSTLSNLSLDSTKIFFTEGHLTSRSDVYGFGVVLLEMLLCRRSMDKTRPNKEYNLVQWVRPSLVHSCKLQKILDPHLWDDICLKSALKALLPWLISA